MAEKRTLPVLLVSKADLVGLLHGYLQKYKNTYSLNMIQDNGQVIQFQVRVFTIDLPALIHAFYKGDKGFSLSYKFGKNQRLGREIVEGVYKLYGIRYNEQSAPQSINLRPDQAEAILNSLSEESWENIETLEDTPSAKKVRFTNSDGDKLVVSYWPKKGRFFPQAQSPSVSILVNDIISRHIDFSSEREISEKLNAIDTGNQALLTRFDVMENHMGFEILKYLSIKNRGLLNTLQDVFQAFIDARTYTTEDYSSIVQRMGRCFEGLMKTLFSESGMAYKKELKDYFQWNPVWRKHYLDDSLAPAGMSYNELFEIGRLYNLFSSTRNPPSHGDDGAHHTNIHTYEEAQTRFEDLVNGGKETYSLMKPYLPNSSRT